MGPTSPLRIELGCGSIKREGFFGIDVAEGPAVDLVLDIEKQPLPFPDASVAYTYSSHTFEHLCAPGSPIQTLREIIRVSKPMATVEIWTPYGKSNDGLLFGHHNFYTETHWKHICFLYADSFYLGPAEGRFLWEKTQYRLWPGILERLRDLGIPLSFAVDHMYNIVEEFGVFLTVDKTLRHAPNPQFPIREVCYERGRVLGTLGSPEFDPPSRAVPSPPPVAPLRYRTVDVLNKWVKSFPSLHRGLKAVVGAIAPRK